MSSGPLARREVLELRARVLERIRDHFRARDVLEVTTPVITACGVSDLHLESIEVKGKPGGWLRTSPEYFHKRLLAAGTGDIFEIGPVFRGSETGHRHQPEFQMLEWYRTGRDLEEISSETVDIVRAAAGGSLDAWPVHNLTWSESCQKVTGQDLRSMTDDELRSLAADAPPGLTRSGCYDWLFSTRIQPALKAGTITVIRDFPPEQAALARIRQDNPPVAERFEVFLGDMELANGYRELTDPAEQRRRFEADNRGRRDSGLPEMPIDEAFLKALESGLPDCAGVALGIDRLVMAIAGADSIDQVITFGH